MPSNQGNQQTTSSHDSITQLSSPLSASSLQELSQTARTIEISRQCESKGRLLVNHKSSDDALGRNVLSKINLKHGKEASSSPPNHVSTNLDNIRNDHDTGVTIVTINDLNGDTGNSIV